MFYKMCLGHVIKCPDNYIGVPLPEAISIKSVAYNIYGYVDNGILKELVTRIPLKLHEESTDENIGYYSRYEVSGKEIADFIRKLEDNESYKLYEEKILNIYERQMTEREPLEKVYLSDSDTIAKFLKRG